MASGLWESERQRASLYVERRRRERLALRNAVFRRVNAQVAYAEHVHFQRRHDHEQRLREQDEMEIDMGLEADDSDRDDAPMRDTTNEEALALDFLGDVNDDDMRSLLVTAATAVATPSTTTAVTTEAVAPTLAPISMPTHLLTTASAASVTPTTTLSGVAVGVSMGEDAGVSELMDELQIDVNSLTATTSTTTTTTTTSSRQRDAPPSDGDEHKTEESTPPRHVLEQRRQREGEKATHASAATKTPLTPTQGGGFNKAFQEVFDPLAAAANEMAGWVTGENDPEVLKRRETLRGDKKRRSVKRFGTNTYLEQATIRRVAKYHAGEGESSSSSSDEVKSDSDFSPQEVVEIEDDEDEQDEPSSDADSLPDDLVIGDDDRQGRKRKSAARRRIRQRPRTKMTIRKSGSTATTSKTRKAVTAAVDRKREEELESVKTREHQYPDAESQAKTASTKAKAIEEPSDDDESEEDHEGKEVMEDQEKQEDQEDQEVVDVKQKSARSPTSAHVDISSSTTVSIGSPIGSSNSSGDQSPEKPRGKLEVVETIDLMSESEAETEPDAGENTDTTRATSDISRDTAMAKHEQDAPADGIKTSLVLKLKVSPLDLQKLRDLSSHHEVFTEQPQDIPVPDDEEGTPIEEDHSQEAEHLQNDGYDTGEIDDGVDGACESDTGTIDLEQEELLSQLEEGTKGSPPTSTSSVAVNGLLNPVEPQVKMSPQHSTPPTSARALNSDSPTTKEAVPDPETVEFKEVSSDIDFGSGESDDFGGDAGAEESDEAEFEQFFQAPNNSDQRGTELGQAKHPQAVEVPAETLTARDSVSLLAPGDVESAPKLVAAPRSLPSDKGSNGLRKVPNINTTIVAKGKYKQVRKAIKILDGDMNVTNPATSVHDPKEKMMSRSRLFVPSGPPLTGEVSPRTCRPLRTSGGRGISGSERYLNYEKTQEPKPNIKEKFANAAKQARERFDKSAASSTVTPLDASKQLTNSSVLFESAPVGTGAGLLKPLVGSMTSDGEYLPPREPQIDIYQATGAITQIDLDDAPLSTFVHKRPNKFQHEIDEAKRQGVYVPKGKPEELDPRSKIPKKSREQLERERSAQITSSVKGHKDSGKTEKQAVTSTSKPKRAKTNKSDDSNGRKSHYGPTQSDSNESRGGKSNKYSGQSSRHGSTDSSSHDSGRRKSDNSARNGSDRKKRQRSPSPPSKNRDRKRSHESERRGEGDRDTRRSREKERDTRDSKVYRSRDSDREIERDRRHDRSRSPSDRRYRRHRSHSPTSRDRWNRSRSRSRSPVRSRYHEDRRHRDDLSNEKPSNNAQRTAPSYAFVEDLTRSMDGDRASTSDSREEHRPDARRQTQVKPPDVLATQDDEGSDIAASDIEFIDFDDQSSPECEYDIRYDLRSIKIDEELRARMVYICNLSPQVDEEHLTERFQAYGIAEQPDLGCLAVDVFLCQRSHKPRGDARITFVSPEAAATAANEQGEAYSGHSRLMVRRMDTHTMRVLEAQFDISRDMWICSNASCRAETSMWTRVCSKCNQHRLFPPSNIKIHPGDWLCSICFYTNAENATRCNCCSSLVPLIEEEKQFYPRRSPPRGGRRY